MIQPDGLKVRVTRGCHAAFPQRRRDVFFGAPIALVTHAAAGERVAGERFDVMPQAVCRDGVERALRGVGHARARGARRRPRDPRERQREHTRTMPKTRPHPSKQCSVFLLSSWPWR